MKQIKIIVLFALMMVGGISCVVDPARRCPRSLPQEIDNLTGARTHRSAPDPPSPPYYLEIENLTGATARMEFHEYQGGVFRFTFSTREVKTVFYGKGSNPETGKEGSPLPKNFLVVAYRYDSVVVRVGNRREAFFQSIACSRSDGCDPPVFENSPDWESGWNLLIKDTWELVEEPRNQCKARGGDWVYRASLRAK